MIPYDKLAEFFTENPKGSFDLPIGTFSWYREEIDLGHSNAVAITFIDEFGLIYRQASRVEPTDGAGTDEQVCQDWRVSLPTMIAKIPALEEWLDIRYSHIPALKPFDKVEHQRARRRRKHRI